MSGPRDHELVAGLKLCVCGIPLRPESLLPPARNMRAVGQMREPAAEDVEAGVDPHIGVRSRRGVPHRGAGVIVDRKRLRRARRRPSRTPAPCRSAAAPRARRPPASRRPGPTGPPGARRRRPRRQPAPHRRALPTPCFAAGRASSAGEWVTESSAACSAAPSNAWWRGRTERCAEQTNERQGRGRRRTNQHLFTLTPPLPGAASRRGRACGTLTPVNLVERLLAIDVSALSDADKTLPVVDPAVRRDDSRRAHGRAGVHGHRRGRPSARAGRAGPGRARRCARDRGERRRRAPCSASCSPPRRAGAAWPGSSPTGSAATCRACAASGCRCSRAARRRGRARRCRAPRSGTTVSCGGVEVHPGDIVFGDDDGVLIAGAERIEAALETAETIGRSERAILSAQARGEALHAPDEPRRARRRTRPRRGQRAGVPGR